MSRPSIAATCHPERKHYGKGLCRPCWSKVRRASDPDRTSAMNRATYQRHAAHRRAHARLRYYADREGAIRRSNAWNAAHPERVRDRSLRRRYGVGMEEYRDNLVGQAGRCLICLRVPGHNLVIDHDHTTGRFRGLLCNPCNRAIGHLRDDPVRAASAARYLRAVA